MGGDLTDEQLVRLEKVAATCPVRRAVESGATFEERIERIERVPSRSVGLAAQ